MNFRLKTSRKTAESLKTLHNSTGLTPNILARFAVCMSLQQEEKISQLVKDVTGIEFNRNTLTGQYDYVFKALITQHAQQEVSDAEYFPDLFNAHLERGIRLLMNEYTYAGNYERMLSNLLEKV